MQPSSQVEDPHAEVRAIIEGSVAKLQAWLDARLQNQEELLQKFSGALELERSSSIVNGQAVKAVTGLQVEKPPNLRAAAWAGTEAKDIPNRSMKAEKEDDLSPRLEVLELGMYVEPFVPPLPHCMGSGADNQSETEPFVLCVSAKTGKAESGLEENSLRGDPEPREDGFKNLKNLSEQVEGDDDDEAIGKQDTTGNKIGKFEKIWMQVAEEGKKDENTTDPQSSKGRGIKMQTKALSGVISGKGQEVDQDAWYAGHAFELLINAIILANVIVMIFDVQYEGLQICYDLKLKGCDAPADKVWPAAEDAFKVLDWIFGIIFTLEAVLKFSMDRCRYFWNSESAISSAWNWLDFTCVVAWLCDKLFSAVLDLGKSAFMLRMLRLIRLARLVRLMRNFQQLDALYVMVVAMRSMGKVLCYALGLLSIMLMACGLFLTQLLQATTFNDVADADFDQQETLVNETLFQYFGTFTRCLLSMFEITLGNWPPVARLLQDHVSEWFMIFSILHKMTIGFAVIGVINGVILQETFKVAGTDNIIMVRQKKKMAAIGREKMRRLFEALDVEGTGELSFEEFSTVATDPDVKFWLSSMDIEMDDLLTLFELIDEDHSGHITLEELATRVPRIKGSARSIDALATKQKINEVTEWMKQIDPTYWGKMQNQSLDNEHSEKKSKKRAISKEMQKEAEDRADRARKAKNLEELLPSEDKVIKSKKGSELLLSR
jgi:Ca2+-binding EF-hand superfamily protein